MKAVLWMMNAVLWVIAAIGSLIELLAFPAFLVIIGGLNQYGTAYDAAAVGDRFRLYVIVELIVCLVCKCLEKKYASFFERKIEPLLDGFVKLFSNKNCNS